MDIDYLTPLWRPLRNDAFVMLDPAVEVLDAEIAENRLLCHGHFAVAMAVPPGEGLLAFVNALMGRPASVGALREEFDDQQLIDKMLASLSLHGFVHVTSSETPSLHDLARLRKTAEQRRNTALRRSVVIDLDGAPSLEHQCARLNTNGAAPDVLLRCRRLGDHQNTLAELARRRQAGALRTHRTVLQTADLMCDYGSCHTLIRLGASVHLEGVPWPAAERPIPGLADLTRNCVAVHALMTPDLSILDEAVRARTNAWVRSAFISGLCLRFDADALWPAGTTDDAFIAAFDAVRALEDDLGDVVMVNLPSDEVLLGNATSSACPDQMSGLASRFRMAYLRWRIPLLKSYEADNTWSQTPEAEDKLIRPQEDLLPTHPDLLLLRPGSVVVDVCGGVGRVARRLSRAVGPQGLIISIEMLRCLSNRAHHFAEQRHLTNLQFRPGLAQRIPLPDTTVDAAVNEWTGAIWELGLGPAMVKEMARVVRPGGRIAVTHRLIQLPLTALAQPWVQYDDIYERMRHAFAQPQLTIVAERVWGQIASSLVGEHASQWRKQYVPRLVDPHDMTYECDEHPGPRADVYLTIVAHRQ